MQVKYCSQANHTSTEQNVEYEESTEEFKHVEKFLHAKMIPEPPQHVAYPTPSGWFPQTG